MILLPGEGITDANISVTCPYCTETVPVSSGSVRKVVKLLNERSIRPDSENRKFKHHFLAISDRRRSQARELYFIREALNDAEDMKDFAELTKRYITKQRMYLSTLQEAAGIYRNVGVLVEKTTEEYNNIVNRALKRNWWLDGDFLDIKASCETMRREKINHERFRDAMIKISQL